MKFNRMLKFTLFALLLSVGFPAFAVDETDPAPETPETPTEPEEVQLASGAKVSWAKFIGAINDPSSITAKVDDTELQAAKKKYEDAVEAAEAAPGNLKDATQKLSDADAAYNSANKTLQEYQAQQNNMSNSQKYTTGPVGWLKTIRTAATQFQTYFNNFYASQGTSNGTEGSISYYTSGSDRWGYNLYISFSGAPEGSTDWQLNKNVQTFDDAIYGKTFSNVYLYLGQSKGENNYPENNGMYVLTYNNQSTTIANTIVTAINTLAKEEGYYEETPTTAYKTLLDNIDEQTKTVNELSDKKAAAQKAYNEASAASTNASALVNTTKAAYEKALEAYNKAVAEAGNAINDYLNVTLLTDITASTPVSKAYSGSIDAQNHIITIPANVNLFGTSYFTNGQLHNAIINGVFATGGKYYNVAAWRGANGIYYDENGNNGGTYTNIGKLAYDNRDLMFFSADIANMKLVKWSKDAQVYDITMYQPNATTQFYTNIADGVFVNNKITNFSKNTFFESKTNDFGDIPNVIVGTECANVVITDKESFYCPKDITASQVSYERTFNAGYNSVCLPFDLTYTYDPEDQNAKIRGLLTYDKQDLTKFWFIVRTGTVNAYTPMLLNANGSFKFNDLGLSAVTIKQTPKAQMLYSEVRPDGSKSCGLLRTATVDEVADTNDESGYKVYGLRGTKFEPAVASDESTPKFPAFRMVIYTPIVPQGVQKRAPRSIGILDENGVEITDEFTSGIEEVIVEAAAPEFSVAGGQGEITITSAADFGKVPVYAIDGKLVTVAEVVEGTTTVNVAGGMYIVMGKRVMVK